MNVKLLIAYHKKALLLKDDILTPIHVGRALADKGTETYRWLEENAIGDDTGENISGKNPSYNELTALYWAWKNYDALGNPDYIGLMHYRRHFIFDEKDRSIVSKVDADYESDYLRRIRYSKKNIERLLSKCDFIYNQGRVSNIYDQYKLHHRTEDLERIISILKEAHPEYAKSADEYLKQSYGCFANMFIFPRDMFFDYCAWLFPLLETFEKQVDLTNRRLFISERLTGIYVYHAMKKGKIGMPLSSTFLDEPLSVDLCARVNKETVFPIAVLLRSILDANRYPKITVNFHLLYDDASLDQTCFDALDGKEILRLDWHKLPKKEFDSPTLLFRLGELFPNVGKMLVLDENTFVFTSLDIIWEACNTFEFLCLYSSDVTENKVYCLNLKWMRQQKIAALSNDNDDFLKALLSTCPEQCKAMAPWVMYNVTKEKDGYGLYPDALRKEKEAAEQVWTKCMLHYESGLEPWKDLRNCFAIYWWDKAATIPSRIPFVKLDEEALVENVRETNLDFLREYDLCEEEAKEREANNKNGGNPSLLSKAKKVAKRILRK